MENPFSGDRYETPPGVPISLFARLLGWTRLPFYWYVYEAVQRGRRLSLAGAFDDAAFIARSVETVRAVERCGGRLIVDGLQHLSATPEPVVLVGNHMSFLETFALPSMVIPRRPLSFVVKDTLLRHPAMAAILSTQRPIAMTRTNPRADLKTMMREGLERLQSGRSVCVFPQSTRSAEFVEAKFNSIGAKLAERAGRPVIPIAVRTDFIGNGVLVKDLGPICRDRVVRFTFGPPIAVADAKDAHRQVVAFIVANLTAWGVVCR